MKEPRHILRELGRRYERTQAGRTGVAERDLLLDYEEFLRDAGCADGEQRHVAERALADAARAHVVKLVPHRRDPKLIQQIRFSREQEQELFRFIGEPSPTERRFSLAQQFKEAACVAVPEEWLERWVEFCGRLEKAALCGESIAPFERGAVETNAELLGITPRLLAWRGESLLRFASCVLCGDSKRLEYLSSRLAQILEKVTEGKLRALEDVGILANPRFVLLHGPLKLLLNGQWLDFGQLVGPFRLSETDIRQAQEIRTTAVRCLTVENETTFHELAKLHSGELLIQTSFPGSATLNLLQWLPATIEFWHFGDTDPEGFNILRDLRERSGRPFQALHMKWRPSASREHLDPSEKRLLQSLLGCASMQAEQETLKRILDEGTKGSFEQESLGKPRHRNWPFYD